MYFTPLLMVSVVIIESFWNARSPMWVTLSGMAMPVSRVSFWKVLSGISLMLVLRATFLSSEQL